MPTFSNLVRQQCEFIDILGTLDFEEAEKEEEESRAALKEDPGDDKLRKRYAAARKRRENAERVRIPRSWGLHKTMESIVEKKKLETRKLYRINLSTANLSRIRRLPVPVRIFQAPLAMCLLIFSIFFVTTTA